jgi:hypothetical protein
MLACGVLCACASSQGVDQKTLARWKSEREAHGVYNHVTVDLAARTIEFTYGSTELRRMSLDEFERFVRDRISGQTVSFAGPVHGLQVEYYGSDGRNALWYPGNDRALLGSYTLRQSDEPINIFGDKPGVLICFLYDGETHNPGTGATGHEEECQSAYAFIAKIKGKMTGDVFNLMTGKIPFVLDNRQPPAWPDGTPLIPTRAAHY